MVLYDILTATGKFKDKVIINKYKNWMDLVIQYDA